MAGGSRCTHPADMMTYSVALSLYCKPLISTRLEECFGPLQIRSSWRRLFYGRRYSSSREASTVSHTSLSSGCGLRNQYRHNWECHHGSSSDRLPGPGVCPGCSGYHHEAGRIRSTRGLIQGCETPKLCIGGQKVLQEARIVSCQVGPNFSGATFGNAILRRDNHGVVMKCVLVLQTMYQF